MRLATSAGDVQPDEGARNCFAQIADDLLVQGWSICDSWFSFEPELVTGLYGELRVKEQSDRLQSAGVGRGHERIVAPDVRRDRLVWLDGQTSLQAGLLARLESFRGYLNRRLFLGLRHFECQFAVYGPGDYYRRHLDSFRGAATRIVSLVLYLNPVWPPEAGGQLRLYMPDDRSQWMDVEPSGGRAVVFLSEDVPHEVLPTAIPRYSVACWFRGDAG